MLRLFRKLAVPGEVFADEEPCGLGDSFRERFEVEGFHDVLRGHDGFYARVSGTDLLTDLTAHVGALNIVDPIGIIRAVHVKAHTFFDVKPVFGYGVRGAGVYAGAAGIAGKPKVFGAILDIIAFRGEAVVFRAAEEH